MAGILSWWTRKVGDMMTVLDRYYLEKLQPLLLPIVEHHLIPDVLIRYFIRREVWFGLKRVRNLSAEQASQETMGFIADIKTMPIAVAQVEANEQHYEVPDAFYKLVLGPHLKYSSGYWPTKNSTLEESEVAMLEMYCERAGLADGMSIIDLGCGWGSVTLFVAQKYPNARITSISNSSSQKEFILATAKSRGLGNVQVFTGDIASFDLPKELHGAADRVISIEMFEHMKNYQLLMEKVSRWLKPKGKLFVHIFTGREVPEHFGKGWMAETFFTGGTMPRCVFDGFCTAVLCTVVLCTVVLCTVVPPTPSNPILPLPTPPPLQQRCPAALLPGPVQNPRPLAHQRIALPAHTRGVACLDRPEKGPGHAHPGQNLRPEKRRQVVRQLAPLFHRLCRVLRVRQRKRVPGLALPF